MVKMVVFVCGTCKNYNNIHCDDEGFTPVASETESLTDAVKEHVEHNHMVWTEYRELNLYHIVLWYEGGIVTSLNVKERDELAALANARLQYPHYTPEISMRKELDEPDTHESNWHRI